MTTPESPADLTRRAADHLDALNGASTMGPWRDDGDGGVWAPMAVVGETLVVDGQFADDAALIVALHPVVALLAAWLRAIADHYDHHGVGNFLSDVGRAAAERLIPGFPQAVAVARAVLGETED